MTERTLTKHTTMSNLPIVMPVGLRARPNTDLAKTYTLLYAWVVGHSINHHYSKKLGDDGDGDGGISTLDEEIQCKGGPSSTVTSRRWHCCGEMLSTEDCWSSNPEGRLPAPLDL